MLRSTQQRKKLPGLTEEAKDSDRQESNQVKDRFEISTLATEFTSERESESLPIIPGRRVRSQRQTKFHRGVLIEEYEAERAEADLDIQRKLDKIYELGKKKIGRKVDNVMKLVSNIRVLEIAYQKIKSNRGALTEGVNDTTADQISEQFFIDLSNSLREETFQWKPVRRVYVDKPGKKENFRPTFENRIVQEAIRIV